jgi:hypothetical protein
MFTILLGMLSRVAIIIPHHNGQKFLKDCLFSLTKTNYDNYQIYLLDNASTDGSPEWAKKNYSKIKIIHSDKNLGYAGGCNLGIKSTKEEYIVLLNNDTIVDKNWLNHLIIVMGSEKDVAAAQPKTLWMKNHTMFDYSAGAGGLLDVYGFPFCRGRIFDTIEKDKGQYDNSKPDIFWASGTALIYRRKALDQVGLLDEDFFMHMEEIDLAWRLHLNGWRIVSVPKSVIYHLSGGSLPAGNYQKMYLNHRNSQIMLLKNYSLINLIRYYPLRIVLEISAFLEAVNLKSWLWAKAIVNAWFWIMKNLFYILRKRKDVQKLRRVPDSVIKNKMYSGSIAVKYYLLNLKTANLLEK